MSLLDDGNEGSQHRASPSDVLPSAMQEGIRDFVKHGERSLSATQAEKVMIECRYPRQRKVDVEHAKALSDIMEAGNWRDYDQLNFARFDGKLILVNGYHRMHAQCISKLTIRWSIVIHDCLTLEAIQELYIKFDTNVRTRTPEQVLSSFDLAGKLGVPKTVAKAVYAAVPFIYHRFSTSKIGRDLSSMRVIERRLDVAEEYGAEARLLAQALHRGTGKINVKLRNGGVAAVALVTLRGQPQRALEFWTRVAMFDGLRKGQPEWALCTALLDSKMDMSRGFQHASYAIPAAAWNAFYSGERLTNINVKDVEFVSIAGTEFGGA